jgi:hypothetical protein
MQTRWIFAVPLLLSSGNAWSRDSYCSVSHVSARDGGEYRATWRVVNSTVRKVRPPETKPTTGCDFSWNSVGGMYRPVEIVQAPKLGQVRIVHTYRVFYTSAKNGQDTMTTRLHWLDKSNGKRSSAIIHYDIQVTDKPL